MNLGQQRVRSERNGAAALASSPREVEIEAHGEFRERELRRIAAFRLRDAANRIATLVGMSDSPELRADLLALHDRLMGEERELFIGSMETGRFKPRAATPKVNKKTA